MLYVTRRRALLFVGGALVVATGWLLYATLFGRPLRETHLQQRIAFDLFWDDPDMVARGGIGDGSFFDRWSSRFTDNSPARTERLAARKRRLLALLRSYPLPEAGTKDRLSREIVDWYLDSEVSGEPFRYHDYLVDSYGGVQASVLEILTELHPLETAGGAEAYVTRLRAVPAKVDGILAGLRLRADRGIVAPRWSLEKVEAEIERFVAPPPGENVLCTTFARKTEATEGLSATRREELLRACRREVGEASFPRTGGCSRRSARSRLGAPRATASGGCPTERPTTRICCATTRRPSCRRRRSTPSACGRSSVWTTSSTGAQAGRVVGGHARRAHARTGDAARERASRPAAGREQLLRAYEDGVARSPSRQRALLPRAANRRDRGPAGAAARRGHLGCGARRRPRAPHAALREHARARADSSLLDRDARLPRDLPGPLRPARHPALAARRAHDPQGRSALRVRGRLGHVRRAPRRGGRPRERPTRQPRVASSPSCGAPCGSSSTPACTSGAGPASRRFPTSPP